ncbi:hypothetical protein EDB86DRAFT_2826331 [Lactarius hatsudake]|nr:hypothetical protein EDB86DRAFT_2826331 [Lactarius hatsudake]
MTQTPTQIGEKQQQVAVGGPSRSSQSKPWSKLAKPETIQTPDSTLMNEILVVNHTNSYLRIPSSAPVLGKSKLLGLYIFRMATFQFSRAARATIYSQAGPKRSYHVAVVFRTSSPEFCASSIGPVGIVPPPGMPASLRLLMLTLPRLRTRGSPMSSFSDSARWRCSFASPADVRLKIACRPRSEVERVGPAPLAGYVAVRCGRESWGRWCASGDDVWMDMENRDVVIDLTEYQKELFDDLVEAEFVVGCDGDNSAE